jgi:hypothetical protein
VILEAPKIFHPKLAKHFRHFVSKVAAHNLAVGTEKFGERREGPRSASERKSYQELALVSFGSHVI